MKNSGIYQIQNVINNKKYIGSAVDIDRRWKEHLYKLKKGIHENKHLQRAFLKYGENSFEFMILEVVMTPEGLILLEQKYLDELYPEYNILPTAGSSLGYKHTEESKKKISEAEKGKSLSEKTKKKISEARKGTHYKQPMSEEGRANISEAHKGNHYPKMSEAHKGKYPSEETRRKLSEAHKNPSKETRIKMSESMKRHWDNKKLKVGAK